MADQRTAMGRSSQRVIEEKYCLVTIGDKWEQLYDEATHHHGAVAGVR